MKTRVVQLVAVLVAVLMVLLGAAAVPAGAADRAPTQKKAGKVKLQLVGAPGVVSGTTLTFVGSASKKTKRKTATLLRRVNDGAWVGVGRAKVGGDGTFAISGIATANGANTWRVTIKTKKRKYVSNVVKSDVYQWYELNDDNDVDETSYVYSGRADIGSQTFPSAMYADDMDTGDSERWTEWNLSYKCVTVSFYYGMDNGSSSGTVGRFSYALDGTRTAIGDRGLGEAAPYQIPVSGRLRIRLNFLLIAGAGYGSPTYAQPQALCLSSPF
ncbi:hypothetical protein [Nocardioides halotolerans]|uniref:hypothetical protein n=1 Tax=Nocardioides halotolerans TaxID=433660 RepID=UPI0012F7292B|nr:hypothetical protein [Nocardioides halotolerans]